MTRITQLDLCSDKMTFSAGHFTIFNATEREHLHGHNYQVAITLDIEVNDQGINFDYRHYKDCVVKLCKPLNLVFLLPENSPHLRLDDQGETLLAHFNDEAIPFLKQDIVILPIPNITVECLSDYFLQQMLAQCNQLDEHGIRAITVKVSNTPGTWGSSRYQNEC